MNRAFSFVVILSIMILAACKNQDSSANPKDLLTLTSVIDISAAKQLLDSGSVIPLDVRTSKEIAEGKIKDALEIDFKQAGFENKLNKLDKSKSYLVYCRSGVRSAKSIKVMQKLGFKQTYDLDGGYTAWSKDYK